MAIAFYRPDLMAVRQRLSQYSGGVGAVTDLISTGAPLAEIRAAYRRVRLEIKIAHADAARRADDLTEAEREYWQQPITEASTQMLASPHRDDAEAFRRSLSDAQDSFSQALSTIDKALR